MQKLSARSSEIIPACIRLLIFVEDFLSTARELDAEADMSDAEDVLEDSDGDNSSEEGNEPVDPDAPVTLPQNLGMKLMARRFFEDCKRR